MTAPTPNAMPGAAPTPPAPPAAPEVTLPAPNAAAPTPPAPAQPEPPKAPKPPWGSDEEFNPQRAWDLITNLRNDIATQKAQTDPIVAEHEALRRASQTEQDRLREDLTASTERESTWRNQAIRAQAEVMATGKFVDTDAAVALIGDLSVFGTPEGVDLPKLQAAFDQLAVNKPNLVTPAPAQGFTPNRAQGQSGNGPNSIDAQILAAQASGNLAQSIALKQQKQYSQKK